MVRKAKNIQMNILGSMQIERRVKLKKKQTYIIKINF